LVGLLIWALCVYIGLYIEDDYPEESIALKIPLFGSLAIIVFTLLAGWFGSAMFRSAALSNIIQIENVEFSDVIAESTEVSDIALMDYLAAKQKVLLFVLTILRRKKILVV